MNNLKRENHSIQKRVFGIVVMSTRKKNVHILFTVFSWVPATTETHFNPSSVNKSTICIIHLNRFEWNVTITRVSVIKTVKIFHSDKQWRHKESDHSCSYSVIVRNRRYILPRSSWTVKHEDGDSAKIVQRLRWA